MLTCFKTFLKHFSLLSGFLGGKITGNRNNSEYKVPYSRILYKWYCDLVNIIPPVFELQREVLRLRKGIYTSYYFKTCTFWLEEDSGYQIIPVMSALDIRPMKWCEITPATCFPSDVTSKSLRAWTALVLQIPLSYSDDRPTTTSCIAGLWLHVLLAQKSKNLEKNAVYNIQCPGQV